MEDGTDLGAAGTHGSDTKRARSVEARALVARCGARLRGVSARTGGFVTDLSACAARLAGNLRVVRYNEYPGYPSRIRQCT